MAERQGTLNKWFIRNDEHFSASRLAKNALYRKYKLKVRDNDEVPRPSRSRSRKRRWRWASDGARVDSGMGPGCLKRPRSRVDPMFRLAAALFATTILAWERLVGQPDRAAGQGRHRIPQAGAGQPPGRPGPGRRRDPGPQSEARADRGGEPTHPHHQTEGIFTIVQDGRHGRACWWRARCR